MSLTAPARIMAILVTGLTISGCSTVTEGDVTACERTYESVLDYDRASMYGYADRDLMDRILIDLTNARTHAEDDGLRAALAELTEATTIPGFKNASSDVIRICRKELHVDI